MHAGANNKQSCSINIVNSSPMKSEFDWDNRQYSNICMFIPLNRHTVGALTAFSQLNYNFNLKSLKNIFLEKNSNLNTLLFRKI